jgi:hypothetical protein
MPRPSNVIKSRMMKKEGNVARVWVMRNSTYIQNVGLKSLRRPICRREDNIKTDRKKQVLNGGENRDQRGLLLRHLRICVEELRKTSVNVSEQALTRRQQQLTATIPLVPQGGERYCGRAAGACNKGPSLSGCLYLETLGRRVRLGSLLHGVGCDRRTICEVSAGQCGTVGPCESDTRGVLQRHLSHSRRSGKCLKLRNSPSL